MIGCAPSLAPAGTAARKRVPSMPAARADAFGLRASIFGVPMVRAVNTGPSSVIDRDGDFLARTVVRDGAGRRPPDTLLVDVPIAGRARSTYASWGAPLSWAIAIGAAGWWLVPWLVAWGRRRRERKRA